MSSPLDRIEELAIERRNAVLAVGGGERVADWAAVAVSTGMVLALVNVAKAAEALRHSPLDRGQGDVLVNQDDYIALREALAVLSRPEPTDKEPT